MKDSTIIYEHVKRVELLEQVLLFDWQHFSFHGPMFQPEMSVWTLSGWNGFVQKWNEWRAETQVLSYEVY